MTEGGRKETKRETVKGVEARTNKALFRKHVRKG